MGLSTTYTKTETDFLIQQLEEKTSDKYNDESNSIANDIIKRVDINTGENVNYRETTTWHDGSTMDDSRVDGFVYKKIGIKYYERIFGNIINVLDCGAIADDITDTSTKAINLAVKVAGTTKTVYIPSGTFWIKAHDENQPEGYPTYDRGIMCQEGTKIKMESDTYLKAIPNGKRHYNIISIFGKNNISIEGGNLVGERYEHPGIEGEWGNGILVFGGNNLTFKNINCYDFWGDGLDFQYFYGRDGSDYNIVSNTVIIDNVHSWNNRRQGMSIEGGRNFKITNSSFNGTNGTAPQFGVDIEPAISPAIVDGIYFENCEFKGNTGAGMGIAGHAEIKNITLENCNFNQNKMFTSDGFIGELKINNCKFIKSDLEVTKGDDIEVINNYFDDSLMYLGGTSIKNNAVVTGNTFILKTSRNFEGNSIRYNNLIFQNNTYDFSQTNEPTIDYESGLTFYGNNLTIKNNVLKSIIAGLIFKNTEGVLFSENKILGNQKVTLHFENAKNVILKNNYYANVSYSSWSNSIYLINGSASKIHFIDECIDQENDVVPKRYPEGNALSRVVGFINNGEINGIVIENLKYISNTEHPKITDIADIVTQNGLSVGDNRPTKNLRVGLQHFDKTLWRVIVWDGAWKDFAGNNV